MLTSKTVVLDLEGFRDKKDNFIVKDLVFVQKTTTIAFSLLCSVKIQRSISTTKEFFLLVDKKFTRVILELRKLPIHLSNTNFSNYSFEKSAVNFLRQGAGKGAIFVHPS